MKHACHLLLIHSAVPQEGMLRKVLFLLKLPTLDMQMEAKLVLQVVGCLHFSVSLLPNNVRCNVIYLEYYFKISFLPLPQQHHWLNILFTFFFSCRLDRESSSNISPKWQNVLWLNGFPLKNHWRHDTREVL